MTHFRFGRGRPLWLAVVLVAGACSATTAVEVADVVATEITAVDASRTEPPETTTVPSTAVPSTAVPAAEVPAVQTSQPEPTPAPDSTATTERAAGVPTEVGQSPPVECVDVGDLGPSVVLLPPWLSGEQRFYEFTKAELDGFGRVTQSTTLVTLDVREASVEGTSFSWTNTAFDLSTLGFPPALLDSVEGELSDALATRFDYGLDPFSVFTGIENPEDVKAQVLNLIGALADVLPADAAEFRQLVDMIDSVPAEDLAAFGAADLEVLHSLEGFDLVPGELLEFDDVLQSPLGFAIPARVSLQLLDGLDADNCVALEMVIRPMRSDELTGLVNEAMTSIVGGELSDEELATVVEVVVSSETRITGQFDAASGYFRSVESIQTVSFDGDTEQTTRRLVDVTPGG